MEAVSKKVISNASPKYRSSLVHIWDLKDERDQIIKTCLEIDTSRRMEMFSAADENMELINVHDQCDTMCYSSPPIWPMTPERIVTLRKNRLRQETESLYSVFHCGWRIMAARQGETEPSKIKALRKFKQRCSKSRSLLVECQQTSADSWHL